ncbi:MAG: Oxidoreductase, short chain dehydrogenase/reductase family [Acidimicrobiales bacterium]|nr:Oxidoreductase, short chain dehydrogenase/reductase family [Acidimicrobiales bacterium]
MELKDRVVVVTGAAKGIGFALAERFVAEGARGVALVDLVAADVEAAADRLGPAALGLAADVSDEAAVADVVARASEALGPIDLFASNAGIGTGAGIEASNEAWQQIWDVNVMAHVYAARAVLPSMLERGEGYLLNTASAAGLLSQIDDAPYSVTKHAAVALAEWLAITYGDQGITVSCLCPQGVRTDMLMGAEGTTGADTVIAQGVIEPEDVAAAVVAGLADGRFLILPHPEVATYLQRKATDPDRWLAGMRRLQQRIIASQ